ncbi:MAG TPA: thioredoxin [Gammaproteobacteria bacterium]|nr:thioredoxin [Gammaproteobacteria bacterium]
MSIFETSLETFDQDVLEASASRPVLVDFWADWCAPCIVIAPILEKVLHDFDGALSLAKLEVDEADNMKLAGHYRVRGFPTIILFHQGREVARFSGAKSRTQILHFLGEHLDIQLPA